MDPKFFRKYADLITEAEQSPDMLEEGWKDTLAGAALAAGLAFGGAGQAHAQPVQPPAHAQQVKAPAQQAGEEQRIIAASQLVNKAFGTNLPTNRADAKTFDSTTQQLLNNLVKTRPQRAPGLSGDSDEFQNSPEGTKWAQQDDALSKAISLRYGLKHGGVDYPGIQKIQ